MWDWRYPINAIRDEVRKLRSNGEVSASLDGIDNILDELSSMYERLESQDIKEESELKDFIKNQKEVISNSYQHAKEYSNIIILGGYAGLFAIWSFTKDQLLKWQVLAVGLLILISLLIYIIFELYGAWIRTTQVNNQMKELEEAEKLNKFPEAYGKSEMRRTKRFMAIWPYFFFGAVVFALSAALILVYSFVSNLFCNYT